MLTYENVRSLQIMSGKVQINGNK